MTAVSTDVYAFILMMIMLLFNRVLTVHGSKDEIVPAEDALEFNKFIPNHKLHIIQGANHEYTSHLQDLASVVLNFVCSKDAATITKSRI